MLLALGAALTEFGDFDRAEVLYVEMIDRARTQGDVGTELHARIAQARLRMLSDPEGWSERGLRLGKEATDVFARLGDELGLAESYDLIGHSHIQQVMVGPAEEAWEQAVLHARAAGSWRAQSMCFSWLALAARFGPTPVDEAVERCEAIFEESRDDRTIQAFVLDARAALEAMRGRFDDARAMVAQARAIYADLGLNVMGANLAQNSGYVEMLAGDAIAAEREFRLGYVALREMDEKGFLSTVAAQLAKALCAQGLLQEAQRFTEISEEAASRDDIQTQVLWRIARGLTLARLGRPREAVATCREAAQLAERTDNLDLRGEALMDLAQVLLLLGKREEAVPVVEEAHELFARKGDLVSARVARDLMEQLGHPA